MRAILQRFAASPPAALRGARCLYTAGSEAAARASPCAPSVFSRAPRRRFSAGAREASGCVGGFSLETRGEAGIVGDFEERRESAISPSSRPSVSRRPLPANFVEETFIPHLESQIVSMAPSFSPLQLAHVGGAYAKLPRALRDAQVEGRLLRRVEESLSSVNSAPEALAVLSLAESLWCGDETPASSSSGNEGFVRRVARRLAGDRGRRPVEAPLFMAIKKRLEIPAVESALSALNLLSVVRAFSKALRHEAAFSSEERSELETFVERSRLRAESLLAEFDAQELIDTVGAIALYRRPNREMLAFFALEEQRLRGAAQAEAASSRSAEEETASETDSVSVSNSSSSSSPKLKQEAEPPDAHLAVLPLLLVQIDRLLARDAFSFFQLLQLLHLLQKSGIKHELLLAECAHFLRTGTYLPKGITDADRDAESPPSEAAGDREKSAFLPSLQVEASELARLSVAEAPDFLRKLGRRIREAGLLDVRNGQQQSAPTAQVCVSTSATSSQTGVAEALPPSLLAKTLWIFAQLGELNLVEDVLERPVSRGGGIGRGVGRGTRFFALGVSPVRADSQSDEEV